MNTTEISLPITVNAPSIFVLIRATLNSVRDVYQDWKLERLLVQGRKDIAAGKCILVSTPEEVDKMFE